MTWTITDIGLLPGGAANIANGTNSDGSVIVGQGDTTGSGGHQRAWIWTEATGYTILGILPGGTYSLARACSHDGSVVVGEADTGSPGIRAFRWTQAGGMLDLGVVGGGYSSTAYAVSTDGTTVGGTLQLSTPPATTVANGFTWTAGGGMVDLGLDGSLNSGGTTALSSSGSIAVGQTEDQTTAWTYNGSFTNLPMLSGKAFSRPQACDLAGDTIVGFTAGLSTGTTIAFRYTVADGIAALPLLSGDDVSEAFGVSWDGDTACGFSGPGTSFSHAWAWTPAEGTFQLPGLSGSPFSIALGVAGNGQVIVGASLTAGSVQHAVFWTPPTAAPTPSGSGDTLCGWRGLSGINWHGLALIGDKFSNTIGFSDFTTYMEYVNGMRFLITSPPVHSDRKRVFVPRFEIEVQAGEGLPTAPESPGIMMLDVSKDGGMTWQNLVKFRSMGEVGEYKKRLRWLKLGQARQWVFRLRYTDSARPVVIGTYLDMFVGLG